MTNLYYTAPPDAAFEDMKQAALQVWQKYADDPYYLAEKTGRIKDIQNIRDNFMYIFAMFDMGNQRACAQLLKPETIHEVRIRMEAGGNDPYYTDTVLGPDLTQR